jgi:hypothetical protein
MRFDSLREYKIFFSQPSLTIVYNGHGILYTEIKRLDCQFENALPPNSLFKAKNVWRCISTSKLIFVINRYSNWLLSNLARTSFRNCENKT